MKYVFFGISYIYIRSLPAWGEWIEITVFQHSPKKSKSLPAWGEWIEIEIALLSLDNNVLSLPAWGEWIEILSLISPVILSGSLPAWGEWIEIRSKHNNTL